MVIASDALLYGNIKTRIPSPSVYRPTRWWKGYRALYQLSKVRGTTSVPGHDRQSIGRLHPATI